jgi:hypothetical protein
MTETDLKFLKLNCRAEATEMMLVALLSALGRSSPTFARSLLETGNQMREEYRKIAFPGAPAEYSDLYAGEMQEAFDSLLSRIENALSNQSAVPGASVRPPA